MTGVLDWRSWDPRSNEIYVENIYSPEEKKLVEKYYLTTRYLTDNKKK